MKSTFQIIPRRTFRVSIVLGLLLTAGACASNILHENLHLVESWNEAVIEAVQKQSTPPALVARNLAILHLSIHDAVNAAEPRFPTYIPSASPGKGSPEEAALGAASFAAKSLYPTHSSCFDRLFNHWRETLKIASDAPGLQTGINSARRMLANREDDGATTNIHYHPKEGPGKWRRTTRNRPPEVPQWPGVRPFVIPSPSHFRPPPPPDLDSPRYAEILNEVRTLGAADSIVRTDEQTTIARFWADFTHTSSPPGHWNEIARALTTGENMDLHGRARLYALLNSAMSDAAISAFDCKYHFDFWRPITAIRNADKDGNESTEVMPDWKPLLPTPSHPEYVSAHSAFSGAACVVLQQLMGSDDLRFEVRSIDIPGEIRHFESLETCAKEIGMSRVFGGIHFRAASEEGLVLGRKVAHSIMSSRLSKSVPDR